MGSKRLEPRRVAMRIDSEDAEEPHEQCARVSIVVHLATAEVVCHAGGREFESRRSRSRNLPASWVSVAYLGATLATATAMGRLLVNLDNMTSGRYA
jgi:hypothetical protein